MKITILCENTVGSHLGSLAEWGFSALIEFKKTTILFDTGYSNVYLHNAKLLEKDLEVVDFVVLSHYHDDHSRGLQFHNFKTRKKIIFHPKILDKLPKSLAKKIKTDFEVILSEEPLEFFKDVFYLGEIPRKNNFEKGAYGKDEILDDSALAIKSKKGVTIISGCSHSGICNICEYAKKITGQKLYAVLGGFHLFKSNVKAIRGTINYFKKEKPEFILPMHCVDFPTMVKFYNALQCKKFSSGDLIEIND